MKPNIHIILAALRCYQKHLGQDSEIDNIATNDDETALPSAEDIDAMCEELNCGGSPVFQPTPFTNEELTTILEVARMAVADADMFADACEAMDISDEVMAALRDKLQAVMDSDVPLYGSPHVVVELIEQRPSVSVHPTEAAAMAHAVQCAMENMWNHDHDENDSRVCFEETLRQYQHIQEGDYEIHILTPTN
jgi:hypothetical protein